MEHNENQSRVNIGWRVLIFMLGFGAIQILLSIAAGIGAAIYFAAKGFDGMDQVATWLQSPEVMLNLTMFLALPSVALSLGWVALCRKFFDRRPLLTLGLGQPRWGWIKTLALGAVAGASPIIACVLALWGLDGLRPTGVTTSLVTWLLVPTFLLMAFLEEVVFRGYLLRNFLEEERPVLGIALTSLLFGLVHSFNPEVWSSPIGPLNLLGAGIVLALAYLVSDDLWFPTALHFAWNLAQGVLFELPVSGLQTDGIVDVEPTGALPGWLTGEGFGLEASVLMTGAEAVLAVIFLVLWRRRIRREPVG